MADILIARLAPLVDEIRLLRAEISRLADLKELELQHLHGLTTRITKASNEDLSATKVAYSDPQYNDIISAVERRAGRTVSDEESAKIMAMLNEDE